MHCFPGARAVCQNRELQIMKMLDHGNVTTLHHYFYTEGEKPDETYLNLVMDFIPQTVYGMSRHYAKAKKTFPLLYMKVRLLMHAIRSPPCCPAACSEADARL